MFTHFILLSNVTELDPKYQGRGETNEIEKVFSKMMMEAV